jgi:hypothetical protein
MKIACISYLKTQITAPKTPLFADKQPQDSQTPNETARNNYFIYIKNYLYIYPNVFLKIYIFKIFFRYFFHGSIAPVAQGLFIIRLHYHAQTHHTRWDSSGRMIGPSLRILLDNTQTPKATANHDLDGIRTRSLSMRTAAGPRLRSRVYWDWQH